MSKYDHRFDSLNPYDLDSVNRNLNGKSSNRDEHELHKRNPYSLDDSCMNDEIDISSSNSHEK